MSGEESYRLVKGGTEFMSLLLAEIDFATRAALTCSSRMTRS